MNMTLQNPKETILVKSGEFVKFRGCCEYHSHEGNDEKCFVPSQAYSMLFDKDEIAPKLGSCVYNILWKLVYRR